MSHMSPRNNEIQTQIYAVLILDSTHIHRDHEMDLSLWIETCMVHATRSVLNMTVNAAIFSATKAIPNSPVAAMSGGVPILKMRYCLFSVSNLYSVNP